MTKIGRVSIFLVFLMGCGFSTAKPEAEALWATYFNAIQSGSYQDVLPLYSETFYEQAPRGEWIQILVRIQEKLGSPQNFELTNWNITAQAHATQSGTVVTLLYQVSYSSYDAQETFVVFKPASGEPASVIGHKINSIGLLQ